MMIINLGATLLHNLDKVMVGWVVGSEGVAYYSVPTQIAFKVHTGIALIVSSDLHSHHRSNRWEIYQHSGKFFFKA